MTKRLFLTSQISYVAHDIAKRLGVEVSKSMVFIDTCIQDRKRPDSELQWHFTNKKKLSEAGFVYDTYDITGKSEAQIGRDLAKYQIIYVEGGNTPYLLKQAQQNNFGQYLKDRVNEGMIYLSTSAGSIIAGPDIRSNDRPGKAAADYGLTSAEGFGLVNFVVMPHWGDPAKKSAYLKHKLPQAYNLGYPFVLLTDHQYVEVIDDLFELIEVK